MALPKPQNPFDWLTQLWNICAGRKLNKDEKDWLLGPIGSIGGISDKFIYTIAESENLKIQRNSPSSGLMNDFEGFNFSNHQVDQRIKDFYLHTTDYEFDVWTQWQPVFGSFGYLVREIFSKRIEQLSLPQRSLETAHGIKSEIILLHNEHTTKYRVWFRRLKKTNEVVYSGVYTHCTLPSGEKCLKIIFPLPQGSATVIMRLTVTKEGFLELMSQGNQSGDPGFYFIVKDRKDQLWQNYLASFHEKIFVYVDDEGKLRADHSMSLWGCQAYQLHYRMTKNTPIV